MPRPTAVDAALRFRNRLAAQETDAAERMGMIYARIHAGMQDDLQALADEIAGMDDPSRGKIYKLARTQRLIRQVEDQATRFGVVVQNEVGIISTRAIEQGTSDTLKLIEASLPELPSALRGQIVASFTTLPAPAIEAAAGLIAADSPLTERLSSAYGEFVAQSFSDHLTEGIAKGQNPRRVASLLDRNSLAGLGRGLTSALTTVRTAQIKSYQIANQANMMANRRIVPEWTWVATLDSRTCMSCIAQHGSVHPVDEALNDHHNGRCVRVPRTISYRDLGIDLPDPVEPFEGGEDWFNRQTQATQRQLMGSGIYEAWKAGKFKFADLSQKYDDDVYGELLRETTLKELTKGTKTGVDKGTVSFGPSGKKVGDALSTQKLKGDALASVNIAIEAIDKIHGDGDLPQIPITSSKTSGFYSSVGATAEKIVIGKFGDNQAFVTAHEIGHFLDHQAFGDKTKGAFGTERKQGTSPALDNVLQEILKTKAWNKLTDIMLTGVVTKSDGSKSRADTRYVNYLMSKQEAWARAYSQYIATKSQHPALLAGLKEDQGGSYPIQWDDDDFIGVSKSIDSLFAERGWVK